MGADSTDPTDPPTETEALSKEDKEVAQEICDAIAKDDWDDFCYNLDAGAFGLKTGMSTLALLAISLY